MANPISSQIKTGTIGELLVQLRLLQYDVQAAPPLKDSGNDLIALNGLHIRTVQVKTTATHRLPDLSDLPAIFHLLAIVKLSGSERTLQLDQSKIYLVPKCDLDHFRGLRGWPARHDYLLTEESVTRLFCRSGLEAPLRFS